VGVIPRLGHVIRDVMNRDHPVHGYAGRPREKTDQADPQGSDATSRVAALEKKIAALEANASKSSGPQPK